MTDSRSTSRRTFLSWGVAASVASFAGPSLSTSAKANLPAAVADFQRRLIGPIYSNPCPFTADLKLDDAGQQRGISRALRFGIRVFATTAGNSKYATLSFDEIKQVNRVMIEAVGGAALTIAAMGDWELDQALAFVRYAEQIGADGIQILLPSRFSGKENEAFEYFDAVARATSQPLVLHGKFSDALLRRLVSIESVAAMKEDHLLEDYVRQQIAFGDRLVIFGGGGENRFYVGWPFGAQAYYATYSTFAPAIAANVWNTIQSGDVKKAASLTAKYDYPLISRFSHGLWHAALELFRISTRHIRPPHKVFGDEQVAELKRFFDAQGVSPDQYA